MSGPEPGTPPGKMTRVYEGDECVVTAPGDAVKECDRLRGALELCLIGGNHIASELVGALGGDFSSKFPPGSNHDDVREAIGYGNSYEMWCCWNAIMRARAMTELNPGK